MSTICPELTASVFGGSCVLFVDHALQKLKVD